MNCPVCDHFESSVTDSRSAPNTIRRRRKCLACQTKFTTYEVTDERLEDQYKWFNAKLKKSLLKLANSL